MPPTSSPTIPFDADVQPRIQRRSSLPFLAVRVVPLAAFITGITGRAVVLFVVLYRTPMGRWKWAWALAVAFGVGQVSMNWTTGAVAPATSSQWTRPSGTE